MFKDITIRSYTVLVFLIGFYFVASLSYCCNLEYKFILNLKGICVSRKKSGKRNRTYSNLFSCMDILDCSVLQRTYFVLLSFGYSHSEFFDLLSYLWQRLQSSSYHSIVKGFINVLTYKVFFKI